MEEQEAGRGAPPVTRKTHRWRNALIILLLILISAFALLFFVFLRYGESVARKYLQDKVLLASDSVYHAGFSRLHINIFTGKVVVDSFMLIPDSLRYASLKQRGKTARALYRISLSSLTIDRVHFWQIYTGRRINFRQLTVDEPVISILAYPDTTAIKTQRWRVFYEDIYPTVSDLFSDFHIDSVRVTRGSFSGSFRQKTGKKSEGDYEFSANLKDVAVNPFSYYNKERVFYSREVDLVVHNFDYSFADSIYTLTAAEMGFSLTKSVIYGKKVALVPSFRRGALRMSAGSELYRFDLPSFSLGGLDLYKVLTGKTVDLDSVTLSDLKVKVYRNSTVKATNPRFLATGKLDLSGLWPIVSGEVKYVKIGQVKLKNGTFSYFASPFDRSPELRIGQVDLTMDNFLLDSVSYRDPARLFYAKGIELSVHDFSLNLRDGIHYVNAASVLFSTRNSLIDVRQCMIWPDRGRSAADTSGMRQNLLDIKVPQLTFYGIDLKKVFNRRIVGFSRLLISEPDVRYTQLHPVANPEPRFRRAEDFFQDENEEVVYNMLKSYLWMVQGDSIIVRNGYARYETPEQQGETPALSGHFDLGMFRFLIDSIHGMNRRGYFYSEDFDLNLRDVALVSPDLTRQFHADTIRVITRDSLIEAHRLTILRSNENSFNPSAPGRLALKALVNIRKLHLTGLNHKKLFLDKQLSATNILLEYPEVNLNSFPRKTIPSIPTQSDSNYTPEFIRSFDIHRCEVRQGKMSYKSQEDELASYFSMKGIDFSVVNALLTLPGEAKQTGTFRFDSLQLSVLPLRAVLADSTYLLEAQSLKAGSYPMKINLKGLRVTPLQKNSTRNSRNLNFAMEIPDIRISGFWFDKAIFRDQWEIDSISITQPEVSLDITRSDNSKSSVVSINPDKLFTLPVFMKSADVRTFFITDGDFSLTRRTDGIVRNVHIRHYELGVDRFHLDTLSGYRHAETPFNAEDVRVKIPGFSRVSDDSLYTFSFAGFSYSTNSSAAQIREIRWKPNYPMELFNGKAGRQTTMVDIEAPRADLINIDIRKLITLQHLHVGCASIPGLHFSAWLDQRVQSPPPSLVPLPHHYLRMVKYPVTIDSVVFSDARFVYEEQIADEPGRLFFDQVAVTIPAVCFPVESGDAKSDTSAMIRVTASGRLMGEGNIRALLTLYVNHPRDSFTIRARMDAMAIPAINPVLKPLTGITIRRGVAEQFDLPEFYASGHGATGTMELRYSDLQIRFEPQRSDPFHRIEKGFLSEGANLLLPLGNPGNNGRTREGIIWQQRDTTRGIFNFIWKSLLSGIKSSAGIETKEQKMIRKRGK
jgi:hypothetical protein